MFTPRALRPGLQALLEPSHAPGIPLAIPPGGRLPRLPLGRIPMNRARPLRLPAWRPLVRLLLLTCLPSAAPAFLGFWDLPAVTDPGTPVVELPAAGRVYQPADRPFRVGVDTLGFSNLNGVVTVAGMSGNCYAMAATTKLFYQAAHFAPEAGERPGFTLAEVAAALRAPGFPQPGFAVRGHADLASLTSTTGLQDAHAWMDQATRHRVGLRTEAPAEAAPRNGDALQDAFRIVTTTHYLHYMQSQAGMLLGGAVRGQGGADALRRTQLATLEELKRTLPRGELGVLTLFNADPRVFFGHVVLAYKVVEPEGGTTSDVYVYENNQVYAPGDAETILRVDRTTGHFEYWSQAAGGQPVKQANDGNPFHYGFWDPSKMLLLLLPDLNAEPALRRDLAMKLSASDEATAYLQASGDLLYQLTRVSPTDAPMRDAFQDYVQALQRSHQRLGVRPAWRTADLPAGATTDQLNQYLAGTTDRTLREVLPHVLPRDLELTGTRLQFDPADPNKATVETTLTLGPRTEIERLARQLEASFLFTGDAQVATLIRSLGALFRGETVTVKLRMELEKKATPAALRAKIGDWMPVPTLKSSHLVIGTMTAGTHDLTRSRHRIEVSERILDKAFQGVLAQAKAFAPLNFTIPGLQGTRTASFGLTKLQLDCQTDSLALRSSFQGFLGVFWNPIQGETGVNYVSNPEVIVRGTPSKGRGKDVFTLRGRTHGWVRARDGLAGFGVDLVVSALNAVAGYVFPRATAGANTAVQAQMASVLSFANGTSFSLGTPSITSSAGRLTMNVPVAPFDVDVGATLATLFGRPVPMEVVDLKVEDDRLVILAQD